MEINQYQIDFIEALDGVLGVMILRPPTIIYSSDHLKDTDDGFISLIDKLHSLSRLSSRGELETISTPYRGGYLILQTHHIQSKRVVIGILSSDENTSNSLHTQTQEILNS